MKICPMMTGRGKYFNTIYCYEEECAWWNEETQCCCIKSFFATDKPKSNSNFPISDQTEFPKNEFIYNGLVNNGYSFEVGV